MLCDRLYPVWIMLPCSSCWSLTSCSIVTMDSNEARGARIRCGSHVAGKTGLYRVWKLYRPNAGWRIEAGPKISANERDCKPDL
jgi:hypothetical protein